MQESLFSNGLVLSLGVLSQLKYAKKRIRHGNIKTIKEQIVRHLPQVKP